MLSSSFLAGTIMLTNGSEIFDNSPLLDGPITFSIDSCEDEDKVIVCRCASFDLRSIIGIK